MKDRCRSFIQVCDIPETELQWLVNRCAALGYAQDGRDRDIVAALAQSELDRRKRAAETGRTL